MAKDNREIVHGIRVMVAPSEGRRTPQSKTLVGGMEDELAAMYSQKELDAMKERGDITGNWKSTKGKFTAKDDSSAAKP